MKGTSSGVEVGVRPRTQVVSRIGFIGRFVREVVLDLMGKGALLHGLDELVDRGIVEEQSVSTVSVEYLRRDRLVGRVTIEIDYERHRINCRKHGDTVTVEMDRDPTSQVSGALAKLVGFYQRFRETVQPAGRLLWTRRPDQDMKDVPTTLEAEPAPPLAWADAAVKDPLEELEYSIEIRPEKLDELTIRARHVDPRVLVEEDVDGHE